MRLGGGYTWVNEDRAHWRALVLRVPNVWVIFSLVSQNII